MTFVAMALVLAAALAAVLARDLVRAVLAFGLCLVGVAIIYGVLEAPYLAAIQLLLYVGGVVTVMVFGVLLTRHPSDARVVVGRGRSWPALVAALGLSVPIGWTILHAPLPARAAPESAATVGARFVTEHVLAFEVLSAVLLAAMIGAIVLARRTEKAP